MFAGPNTRFSHNIKQTWDKSRLTSPEFSSLALSPLGKFDSSKHHSGYSMLSKTFTNSLNDKKGKDHSKFILDDRVVYHSLTNPLFKSKTLNFNNEAEYPRIIGDVHKFSSPFESNWIFSPKLNKFVDKHKTTPLDDFHSIFHALKIDHLDEHKESAIEPPPDTVFPAPSNLDLEHYHNKLGEDSIDSLTNLGKDQFDEIIKDNTDILKDIKDIPILKDLTEKPSIGESKTPKNASYFGYNLQEVKTPQGKVEGVMQIFDKNGLAQKIHYDEKGVLNKTISNATTHSTKQKSASIPDKNHLHNVIKTAVNELKGNNTKSNGKSDLPNNHKNIGKNSATDFSKSTKPEVKKITVKIEGHNFSNSSSPQQNHNHAINELKSPENILSDFLQQLNVPSNTPENANVRTDVHNSFHETVSENSYSYH